MNELVVICEGETEQTFVRDQLAGHLALNGISAWAVLPGRSRNRGGVKKWEVAQQDIVRTLKEGRFCTTMMDFYAMPDDWPGRVDARSVAWNLRASLVENKITEEIIGVMGGKFDPRFFIPYVQLHEFEALAFADVKHLTSVVAPLSQVGKNRLAQAFVEILEQAGHPEAINDGYETCPSRRIEGVVKAYKKRVHGPIVTARIGLNALRERCDHFDSWVQQLESIGN